MTFGIVESFLKAFFDGSIGDLNLAIELWMGNWRIEHLYAYVFCPFLELVVLEWCPVISDDGPWCPV